MTLEFQKKTSFRWLVLTG